MSSGSADIEAVKQLNSTLLFAFNPVILVWFLGGNIWSSKGMGPRAVSRTFSGAS